MGALEIQLLVVLLVIVIAAAIFVFRYLSKVQTFDLVEYERIAVFKHTGEFISVRGPGRIRILPTFLFFSGEIVRDEDGAPVTHSNADTGRFDLRERPAYPEGRSHRQHCITADSAVVEIEPAVIYQITDPAKLVLNVQGHYDALRTAINATLLAVVGTMTLTEVITGREIIAAQTAARLTEQAERWGITLVSVEIQDITPDKEVENAMNERRAAEERAERDRQNLVVGAEARRQGAETDNQTAIALAEAEKQASITRAEAQKQAAITIAEGERAAEILRSQGAESLYKVLMNLGDGADIALRYEQIQALKNLGDSTNSKLVIVPANMAAVSDLRDIPLIEHVIPPA